MTGAVSLVRKVVDADVEHTIDRSALRVGRCSRYCMVSLSPEADDDVVRDRVVEPDGDGVKRVVELPVRQAASGADSEGWLGVDEVVMSRHKGRATSVGSVGMYLGEHRDSRRLEAASPAGWKPALLTSAQLPEERRHPAGWPSGFQPLSARKPEPAPAAPAARS